jgi:lysophospholipase L1-like esterase
MVVEIGSDVPRRDQRGFEYSSRSRRGMRMRMTVSASRRPTARTSGLVRRARAIAILLALVLSACTSAQGQDAGRSSAAIGPDDASGASAPAAEPGWRLVAIGDSLAQATACDGCRDFVQLYGQAITDATGVPVDVDERTAVQFSNLPAVEATQLLNDLLTDQSLRNAIADADIILINVGFNDTPWNRLDNPCGASNYTATVIRWNEVTPACTARVASEYKRTLDEIFTQIDELRGCWRPKGEPTTCGQRGGDDTVLRLTTVYNDWIGYDGTSKAALAPSELADEVFVDAQCWVVVMHGGQCADLFHLLNGPNGTRDAGPYLVDDHTHLNQRGHQRVADALITLGLSPLA